MKSLTFKLFAVLFLLSSCTKTSHKPTIAATINPIAAILKEIVGPGYEVVTILQPGASPHTYSPSTSDMKTIESANALFYVSDDLDGWATKLPINNTYRVIDWLSNDLILKFEDSSIMITDDNSSLNDHHNEISGTDPHFWTDPQAVKDILPQLVKKLCEIDPDNANLFKQNLNTMSSKLDQLDHKIGSMLAPIKGKTAFLFHPSFRYFLKRYNINYGGSIELAPGKEPTPRYIIELSEKISRAGCKSLFTEPQLPEVPAKAIAEMLNLKLFMLDPNGGIKDRTTYEELMMYNAKTFLEALE
jgi:zinc transport system substrate-binding protein